MYTQCPECGSVYRITSAHLKQAAGEVQCGECETRFDALDRLSDVFPKAATGPASRMPAPPEESDREESAPDGEEAPADREVSAESDDEAAADQSNEAETQAASGPEPDEGAAGEGREDDGAGDEREPGTDETDRGDEGDEGVPAGVEEDAGETRAEEGDSGETPVPAQEAAGDEDEPTIDLEQTAEHLFALEDLSDQVVPDLNRMEFSEGLPVPAEVEAEEVAGQEVAPPEELTRRRHGDLARWIRRLLLAAAILVAGAYWIHDQRGLLMRNPALAPWLEAVYGRLGQTVATTWDVGRFRILDSSAELDAGGDLQVQLSFMNEGDFAQPYPVLRIILEDRWGDEIGSRDIQPSEYVSDYAGGRPFAPSERATGRASVIRPGLEAVGFRLDLCLPSTTDPGMDCLSEQP